MQIPSWTLWWGFIPVTPIMLGGYLLGMRVVANIENEPMLCLATSIYLFI